MAAVLIGIPMGAGAGEGGTESGPVALRSAGLPRAIAALGLSVQDRGDLAPRPTSGRAGRGGLKDLPAVAAWARAIRDAALDASAQSIPVFLGGDHSLSLGTLPGLAERAERMGRPFFVLWIDAHPDCHTLATTASGHLHGTPIAHALGAPGFAPHFDPPTALLRPERLMMLGIRSVDAAERAFLADRRIAVHAPAELRALGVEAALRPWLDGIARIGGVLHVSLDADALDPTVAPGVGTPVPGGLRVDEAAAAMSAVAAAGVLGSLEIAEVNPFLDRGGRTAGLMAELAAAALRPELGARCARR